MKRFKKLYTFTNKTIEETTKVICKKSTFLLAQLITLMTCGEGVYDRELLLNLNVILIKTVERKVARHGFCVMIEVCKSKGTS